MTVQSDIMQEEVTTIDHQTPQQIVTKTIRQVEPQAHEGASQKVYEKKKTIFRFNQIIWYILGLIEVLLVFRVVLKALGANQFVGFTSLLYSLISSELRSPTVRSRDGVNPVSFWGTMKRWD